jgi:type I restriction enzyme, S subunit
MKLVKLGESCKFFNGKAHEKNIDINGKFVVVNSKCISSNFKIQKFTNEQLFPLFKNDIVMVMSDVPNGKALAKCRLIEEDKKYSLNQRIACIRSDTFYIPYLLYQLDRNPYFLKFDNGENQTNLRKDDILNCPLYLPSIGEQQRIVAKLDSAFAEIDKGINQTNKYIENTNLLFEKKIEQYFINNITNSPIVKLKDISEYFNGLTYSPDDICDDGTIVLRSGNIQNGKMSYFDIKKVNKKIKDKLFVRPNDILICSRNGSQKLIGKSSLIGEIKEPMTFGTFMMIVRSEHNEYLQWFIKSKLFKKQILKGENTMINQITRYMLDDISLPFPDKKNYTKIANELAELDGYLRILNDTLNIKINNFNALKSSILKQEFVNNAA